MEDSVTKAYANENFEENLSKSSLAKLTKTNFNFSLEIQF